MRISTVLKVLGLLVVAVIVAIAAILLTIDPNSYKGEIQAAAKDATGRDLHIDGDIGFDVGLTFGLSVEQVRFANASWGSKPDMLTAGEVGIQVALLPLILGNLAVEGLTIRDAVILIETDRDGRRNTDFDNSSAAASSGTAISVSINNVEIENATVTLLNAQTGENIRLLLSKLSASGDSAQAPLDVELVADLTMDGRQLPLELDGRIGAPALLKSGDQPFPVDLSGKALGFDFKAKGAINDIATMTGIALVLEASANDLSGLRPFAGDALPTASPFSFKGSVTGSDKELAIDGLAVNLGSTEIGGKLVVNLSGVRPRLEGTITAPKIDLTELVPARSDGAAGGAATGDGGSSGTGAAAAGGRAGKVFPNDPLPFDGLKAADAKLSVAIAELIAPAMKLADVSGEILLDNGNLAVDPFGFTMSESRFDGNVSVAARSTPAKVGFGLNAPKIDMGTILKEQLEFEMLRGEAAVDIDVAGSGDSVAAIMASLSGHSRFLMADGQAKTEDFDLVLGGVSGVLGALFGKSKQWTALNCLVSDFEIDGGVAKSRATFMDTELLLISVDGQADLGQETLALKVTPAPKSTTANVTVPIKIGGTLADPRSTPVQLAAAMKIGSLLGVVAFPPAAVAGLTKLGGADNECVKIARESAEAQPASGDDTGSKVKEITKDPDKALE